MRKDDDEDVAEELELPNEDKLVPDVAVTLACNPVPFLADAKELIVPLGDKRVELTAIDSTEIESN